jgi:hypothetical protein
MTRGPLLSRSDAASTKRLDDALKRLIRLLAQQAAGETCAGGPRIPENQSNAEYET